MNSSLVETLRRSDVNIVKGSFLDLTATQVTGHYLFVTSSSYDGNLGGLAGADSLCQAAAASGRETGSLSTIWTALLSTSGTSASSRVTITAPVFNVAGEELASDAGELWFGALRTPVWFDENGSRTNTVAWTGSDQNGNPSVRTCLDWTSASALEVGRYGASSASDSNWLSFASTGCSGAISNLYCTSDTPTSKDTYLLP